MSMNSNMVHRFSNVPTADIQRSSFQRNFSHKTTFDADYLVPILVDDIIPGDTFNVKCNFVTRLASPTVLTLMDNMFVETFFFFCPYRLIWDNWERFCGAQDTPASSIDFTIPVISDSSTVIPGDVADYMGMPAFDGDALSVSALPFRAYRLIWNEWFRDQNLQDSVSVLTDNGSDTNAECGYADPPLKRGKRHDYFTSSLPWPQKGSTAVSLPLGTTAPVHAGTTGGITDEISVYVDGLTSYRDLLPVTGDSVIPNAVEDTGLNRLYADLSSATASTINDIRLAFQTQKLLERDARSGTRYVETLKAHWGVTSPDFRLQRPEFLGGGSSRLEMSAVAQTTYKSGASLADGKGTMSSIGQAQGTHGFTKSFVEHGVIIGLANVRADLTYSQGIDRYWHKTTRYNFYYPVLAQIGEQAVFNQEIFFQGTGADITVFGYQERYAEYRYKNSMLTGLMRVDAASNLDEYHLSEDFSSLPTLGNTFIQANLTTPLDRAIAIPSQPQFLADFFFEMKCARPMPMFGVPGNLDRF